MPRKRANGEGSIYLRRDGRWCAAIVGPDGRRKTIYGLTREEVRRRLTDVVHSKDAGTYVNTGGLTVGQYLDRWLADVAKPAVRSSTYAGYEVNVRLHIKPEIGRVPLDKLSPVHVQALLNKNLAQGLSPKSVRNIQGTLRTALEQAKHWGMVARNAAEHIDGPKVERFDIQPLTPDEARTFLASIRGDRLEALYSVALTMGLRQGEALGLRWQDVDLDMGYLRVSKQLQRVDGRFQLVEPKTSRSRRTLAMPASIATRLGEHCQRQNEERRAKGDRWESSDLVFTTSQGRPLDGTVVSHHFHRVLHRARLPQRRFHDLRHSCATLLLVQGVSPRVVMDVLGHSQIALTMNTYSHVIPELKRGAAERMEDLIVNRER